MAPDKDKLGDTFRKKEKADEDRYFAERDKERLEALRREASPSVPLGMCPRCGIALEEVDRQGVKVDCCRRCKGVWLDAGELEAVVIRDSESWFSQWVRSVLDG